MKAVTAAEGQAIFAQVPFTRLLDARPELGNVIGAVHGGVLVTLLDVAMASAAVSLFDFRYLPLPQAASPTQETKP